MFQNHNNQQAKFLYLQIINGTRQPILFTKGHVDDTFDGRFRLMHLLLGIMLYGINNYTLGRTILEECITDLDGNYREMGVGDMKFSKIMKKSNALMCLNVSIYKKLSINPPVNKSNKVIWSSSLNEHLFPDNFNKISDADCIKYWFKQISVWIESVEKIKLDNKNSKSNDYKDIFKVNSSYWL